MGHVDPGPCEAMGVAFTCTALPAAVDVDPALTHLVAGYYHVCGLSVAGEVLCWGDQEERQLGDVADPERCVWAPPASDPRPRSRTPRAVDTGGRLFRTLRAGGFHTCGLTEAGEAFCWGANTFGQLGLAPGGSPGTPAAVEGGLRWADLALGQVHTCGITADGDAYCWGDGAWHQLGSGDEQASRPAKVLPPTG